MKILETTASQVAEDINTTRAMLISPDYAVTLSEVQLPEMGAEDVRLRALTTGVSIGTEQLWMREKSKGQHIITGYQCVGVIEDMGADVVGFEIGQRVCYRGTNGMSLAGETIVSANGAHTEYAVVHKRQLLAVPESVDTQLATFFVSAGTGLHGVERANPQIDEFVVVQGCGLIGLGVIAVSMLRGARVIAVDPVAERLQTAKAMGAEFTIQVGEVDVAEKVKEITGEGAHVVFDATGIAACIPTAIACCRRHARFVYQGNYGIVDVAHPFRATHGKEITLINTCGFGGKPAAEAFLRLLSYGAIPWQPAVDLVLSPEEAAPVLDDLLHLRRADVCGLAIKWSEQ